MVADTKTRIPTSAIQAPTPDTISGMNHAIVLRQLKEATEIGQRLRGDPSYSFVRVSDLVDAGLIRLVGGVVQPPNTTVNGGGAYLAGNTALTTIESLTGGGKLSAGLSLSLVNDSSSPGNNMLYGTNGSGIKGWYAAAGGGSTTLAGLTDVSISSPANGQILTYNSSASKWENAGASTSANITPDTHPTSPTAWNDEFEYGTSVDTTGARFSGANAWTWINQGTATGNVAQGALALTDGPASATDNWRLILQAVPSGAWAFRAKLKAYLFANYQNYGLVLYNSANGKLINFGPTWNGGAINATVHEYTNKTTYSSSIIVVNEPYLPAAQTFPVYYEITYDGSSALNFLASASGYNSDFTSTTNSTVAAFLGGITHIGLGTNPNNSTYPSTLFVDWFRRTA